MHLVVTSGEEEVEVQNNFPRVESLGEHEGKYRERRREWELHCFKLKDDEIHHSRSAISCFFAIDSCQDRKR